MKSIAAIFLSLLLIGFGFGCSHNKNAAENGTQEMTSTESGSQGAGSEGTATEATGTDQSTVQSGKNATEPSEPGSTTTDADRSDPTAGATTHTGEQRPDQIQTEQQSMTAPGGANDPALKASVDKVIQDQALSNVQASVDNGVVTLVGTVSSQEQATQLINTIKAMQDVKDVRSRITVEQQ